MSVQEPRSEPRPSIPAAFALDLSRSQHASYRRALRTLNSAGVPFVVGGGFAVYHYLGIWRNTPDLDLFLLPSDLDRALEALVQARFQEAEASSDWQASVKLGSASVDLIYGSRSRLAPVDQLWLDRGETALLLGVPVRVTAIEELIWSKAYVAARERFDGSDIAHLLLKSAGRIDWRHLLKRFGGHWQLLFFHLCLFQFAYPHDRGIVPPEVMDGLVAKEREALARPAPRTRVCRGTLLDQTSFAVDIAEGYADPLIGSPEAELVPGRRRSRSGSG